MHLPRAMRRLLFRRTRGPAEPNEEDETAPSRALVGGMVLVTAAVAVVATCVGKQAARSADALGRALASDLVTPSPGSPPAAIAEAPPARQVSPPAATSASPPPAASSDELDRAGQTTTTGETVRVLPSVQTAPPARRDRDAGAAASATALPPATEPTASASVTSPAAVAVDAAASVPAPAAPAARPDAGSVTAPAPTGGAGPFLTEPPPWGASAYESNPEAGAGAFGSGR